MIIFPTKIVNNINDKQKIIIMLTYSSCIIISLPVFCLNTIY